MDKLLESSLAALGLSHKESKFFMTCFKGGPATIPEIAKAARIERSTAYLVAQELTSRGLIHEDLRKYRKRLIAVEPKTLARMLFARERAIGRRGLELEENIAELQSLYAASEVRPKVRVFEGIDGLVEVKKDILRIPQEILLWTNQDAERNFFSEEQHRDFIQERVRKKIPIRVLAIDNRDGKTLQAGDAEFNRRTKLLPKRTEFSSETYIYGSKIAILDCKKDIIGIIIESEPIAASQRAIFELNWNIL